MAKFTRKRPATLPRVWLHRDHRAPGFVTHVPPVADNFRQALSKPGARLLADPCIRDQSPLPPKSRRPSKIPLISCGGCDGSDGAALVRLPQTFLVRPWFPPHRHPFVRSICSLCLVARESFILPVAADEGEAAGRISQVFLRLDRERGGGNRWHNLTEGGCATKLVSHATPAKSWSSPPALTEKGQRPTNFVMPFVL